MTDKWDGKYYKENSSKQKQSGIKFIDEITFNENESVLDIGCGDGRITYYISQKVSHGFVLGIDASSNMIQQAKKNFSDAPNLEFECVDVTTFHTDKIFDYAVSFSTLHWVKDQLTAFKNIKKVLKPNGAFMFYMGTKNSSVGEAIEILCKQQKWKSCFKNTEDRYFGKTKDEIEPLLHAAGFTNMNIETIKELSHHNSFDELLQWSMAWVPHNTGLAHNEALEFAKDMIKTIYERQDASLDGPVTTYASFLKVKAW